MQTTKTIDPVREPFDGSRINVPERGFRVMLALVSSDGTEAQELRKRLGISDSEYRKLLDGLQQQYLVDVVSQLKGERVRETLSLTESGRSVLTGMMERMCELPE